MSIGTCHFYFDSVLYCHGFSIEKCRLVDVVLSALDSFIHSSCRDGICVESSTEEMVTPVIHTDIGANTNIMLIHCFVLTFFKIFFHILQEL